MNGRQDGTWGWFLQRITAFYLAFGLAVHFIYAHYVMTRPITFSQVAERLSSPWWVAFDLSLLFTVVFHGLNGLWGVLLDLNPSPFCRKLTGWVLLLAGLALSVVGAWLIVPFSS